MLFRKSGALISQAGTNMSSVTADISLDAPRPFYTNLDTFSGKVKIRVRKEIDVTEITLKLKADIITEVLFHHTERASFFAAGTGSQRPDISMDPSVITDLPDFSQAAAGTVQYQQRPYHKLESSIDRRTSFDSSRSSQSSGSSRSRREEKRDRREERRERRSEDRAARRETRDRSKEETEPGRRDRSANGEERLYIEQVILFPPEDVRARTSGKGFTLPAGEHVYDFKLRIPHSDHQYPASLTGPPDTFKIVHALKVTVNRSSRFKMNTRVASPFRYVPFRQPSSLAETGPVELYGEQLGPFGAVMLLGRLPSSQVEAAFPGSTWRLPLTLRFNSPKPVDVLVLSIWLEACTARTGTDVNGGKHHDKTVESIPLLQVPINRSLTTADFSQMIQAKALDKFVVPSIDQRVLDRVYFLRGKITFLGSAGKQAVDVRDKITIVPPAMSQPPLQPSASPIQVQANTPNWPQEAVEPGKVIPQQTKQSSDPGHSQQYSQHSYPAEKSQYGQPQYGQVQPQLGACVLPVDNHAPSSSSYQSFPTSDNFDQLSVQPTGQSVGENASYNPSSFAPAPFQQSHAADERYSASSETPPPSLPNRPSQPPQDDTPPPYIP